MNVDSTPKSTQSTNNWQNPTKNAGLSQGAKIGLTTAITTVGTLGLAYLTMQPSSQTPTSWWGGDQPSTDYTPLIATGLVGIFTTATCYLTGACRTAEEKEPKNSPSGPKTDSNQLSSSTETSSTKKMSYEDSYKLAVDELVEKLKDGTSLNRYEILNSFIKQMSKEVSEDTVTELVDYFIDHFVNKLNNKKVKAELLRDIYSHLEKYHPNSACKVAMQIKDPIELYSTTTEDIETASNHYYLVINAIQNLENLNDENANAFAEWKNMMQTITFRPDFNWTFKESPILVLENIKNEFNQTKELTEEMSIKVDAIVNHLYYTAYPEHRPKTIFELANPRYSDVIKWKYLSDKNDLKLARDAADLIGSFINETNSELKAKIAIEAFKKYKLMDIPSAAKIAFACVGHNELGAIIDDANGHYEFVMPFLELCLEQADASEEHRKAAEKIWNRHSGTQARSEFLMICAKVNNEFCQNVLDETYKMRVKTGDNNWNTVFIAEACSKNLLTPDNKISQAHKTWALSIDSSYAYHGAHIFKNALYAFMKANNCKSVPEFYALVKSVNESNSTDQLTQEDAEWFMRSASYQMQQEVEAISNGDPESQKLLKQS